MPGYGRQYWADRTAGHQRHAYSVFRGNTTADAVVIGAGLTGATTAFVLAKAGMKVVVLEAARVAAGGTSGGLGAILPQPDAAFQAVEREAGLRVARTAWKEARHGAVEMASLLRKLAIKCDLSPAALVINARTSPDAALLRREQTARKDAGIDTSWIRPAPSASEIGTDTAGSLSLREGFLFDPVRATLGLSAAAESAGAAIFEQSSVKRTRFTRKYADVILATGTIRTTAIIVATGGPGALFAQLRRHVRELEGYVVVTEPLSATMRRETGRRASVLTEAGDGPHWLRWLPDDRALFAGALSRPVGPRLRDRAMVQRTAQLMYELSVRYPAISGLPAKWGWTVPVVSTSDSLPWIGPHRNYPFHFFAMALGWHGDGLAWSAARAALRHFSGQSRREDDTLGFMRHL